MVRRNYKREITVMITMVVIYSLHELSKVQDINPGSEKKIKRWKYVAQSQ